MTATLLLAFAVVVAAPPGVVVAHTPAATKQYIGSPGLAVLDDGTYLASHDLFGPGSTRDVTRVYASTDRGATWTRRAEVKGQWWSSLFEHRGAVYLLGTSKEYGHTVIRKSTDGGRTWTTPADAKTGLLLADGMYHCAPVPVVEHGGRLWRAMEEYTGPKWGAFKAFVMSAPADADLLAAASWTSTNRLAGDPAWRGGKFGGWLEGNVVAGPGGPLVNLLRVEQPDFAEVAARATISADGRTLAFDPTTGFVPMPGGAKKFQMRFDPWTNAYWALANVIPPEFRTAGRRPAQQRNNLVLLKSADMKAWSEVRVLAAHPDPIRHGFQYPDWRFEGPDIIALVRTAFDEAGGQAHNAHDANHLTFHRVPGVRNARIENYRRYGLVGVRTCGYARGRTRSGGPPVTATGSCVRCRTPLTDATPPGLCPTCVGSDTSMTVGVRTPVPWRPRRPTPPPGYDLDGDLGCGGMGVVLRAKERTTGRHVAVKYLHTYACPATADRFRVEAAVLATIADPHVVPVYYVADGPDPFFTMEYLPGGSLAGRLQSGRLPAADAARIVEHLARGAAAAHARGILHRDIKPSNALFAADGTAKLADFGLAKLRPFAQPLTHPAALVGTPCYMSPEQAAGNNAAVAETADVYGLGATLYECLTGMPPFAAGPPAEVSHRVQHGEPKPLGSGVPAGLAAVCLKCLEKKPQRRYSSAAALADDLARWRRGEPTRAKPAGPGRRLARRARRHWQPLAAAALLVAVGLAAAVVAAPAATPNDRARATIAAGRVAVLADADGARAFEVVAGEGQPLAPPGCAFGFRSAESAVVHLLDDPGTDRYRVTAELVHHLTVSDVNAGHAAAELDAVGIVVGSRPLGGNHPGRAAWTAWVGDDPDHPFLKFTHVVVLTDPLEKSRTFAADRLAMPTSVGRKPRRIVIDATPEGVTVRHDGRTARLNAAQLNEAAATASIDPADQKPGLTAARWHPRGPVGIWVLRSWIGVASFTVEPLPDDVP